MATCGPTPIGAATHFALFDLYGRAFTLDESSTSRLRQQLPDVKGLNPISKAGKGDDTPAIQRLPSVAAGTGWFDYKFPTSPEFFIGRDDPLADISQAIDWIHEGSTAVRAIQITSRSGVGKSSVLLKLSAVAGDDVVVTVDGRNVRVPSDLRLLVSELTESVNGHVGSSVRVPRSQDELQDALQTVGDELIQASKAAIIQVDQFESVLSTSKLRLNLYSSQ